MTTSGPGRSSGQASNRASAYLRPRPHSIQRTRRGLARRYSWISAALSEGSSTTPLYRTSRAEQFRLKLLSIVLHETNHLVFPQESEGSVRERSLAFYREVLANYVEHTLATLSFTIDRSFSRFG